MSEPGMQEFKRSDNLFMKLTIDTKTLLAALNRAKPVASGAVSLPILSCFLLTAGEKLTVAANNLDVFISTDAEANVSQPGSVCVSARRLVEVIAALGSGELEISADAKFFVSIKRGASRITLAGLTPTEFPPAATPDWSRHVSLPQSKLKEAFERTLPFVSTEESRYILNGVSIDGTGGGMNAVTADGRKLRAFPMGATFKGEAVVIPTGAAKLIAALCDGEEAVQLSFTDNAVRAQANEWRIVAKLIEGAFPAWKNIIPKETTIEATGGREALLNAISVAELTSNREQKIPVVRFDFSRKLSTVISETANVGDASVEIEGMACTQDLSISFDPSRMRELLRSFSSETVTLQFESPISPAKIEDETGVGMVQSCRTINEMEKK